MIKVKKDDSLSTIIGKIQASEKKEIFLNFPVGHGIIHDFNSLKILKKSFKDKKLIFISKDISVKKYFTKLGMNFSLIKDEVFLKNSLEKEKNLVKANTSFGEYFLYEFQKKGEQIHKKLQKKTKKKYNHSFPFIFVGTIFTISLFLLFFIFYLAVHKTYIYVTPEIEVLKVQRNFNFNNSTELSLDDSTIRLREIDIETSLVETFSATNIEYESTKQASGEVVLTNELGKGITLVEGTRFLSDQGVVYKLQKKTDIKPGNILDNGEVEVAETTVFVVADGFDTEGRFIGSRGNTEGIILSIPGLTGEFKNRIYGKSKILEGGIDTYNVIVGEDDIEKASELLKIKLQDLALKKVQEKIKLLNKENNENYSLLLSDNTLNYTDFIFNNSEEISVGDKVRRFELDGSIRLKAYLYNKDFIFSRLKNIVNRKLLVENQNLIHTDNNSLSIAHMIYDRGDEEGNITIKATMEIEAFVRKSLGQNDYYTELLKNKIVNLSKEDAYDILLNTNNINKVSIRNSPFFIKKISSKTENIFFKVKN